MYKKVLRYAFAVCAVAFTASAAFAAKDSIIVTGQTSLGGFTPSIQPNFNEYFYAFTLPAGTALADTIPILFNLVDNPPPTAGNAYNVTLKAVGQVASAISFDITPFSMTVPSSVTHYAYISTTGLSAGDYHANVQVDASPSSQVDISHATLHLLIHVIDPNVPPPPTCYITDSSGLLLTDCNGDPVNTSGDFLVVYNKSKITSTNPGQFYYNFVWTNETGGPVTFTSLGLVGSNVVPQGTNSVHVLIYDSSQFTANFDNVNQNGVACGTVGTTCKSPITVPDGQTLWLTWHVSYQWIGQTLWPDIPAPGTAGCGVPSPHGTISMSATLVTQDQSLSLTCAAGANGQKIQ